MSKVLAVIRREFRERVRQRWFWVMALLGPLFFAGLFFLPLLLAKTGGVKRIVVVDGTSTSFGTGVASALQQSGVFTAVRIPARAGLVDSLTRAVGTKELDGFLLLTDATVDSGKAEYRSSNVSAFRTIAVLERTLAQLATAERLKRAGVNPVVVATAQVRVDLTTKKITGGKTTGESAAQSFSLAYFMSYILLLAIIIYGVNVMSSVVEEKTNRVMEVLLSSVKPFQLMAGKVLGVGAVSIFQFLIWAVSARFLLRIRGRVASADSLRDSASVFQVPHVSLATAAIFAACFIGGFLLYSSMYAAVGAISSTDQEARQAQQPVTWLLMLSFFGMLGMLNDPGSKLAVVLSLIPFTSPIAVPARWAAGTLSAGEVSLALTLLAVGIGAVTWVAARIYRVGILMTGKRPSLKEIVRWVRAG